MLYNQYLDYLNKLDYDNFNNINFKSNPIYNEILEHVNYDLGLKYLNLIQEEYINIDKDSIIGFLHINDTYGFPKKYEYTFKNEKIFCSPTSLRYIYHSLVILDHYKNSQCKNIVEVGCGYGGLCLAINYFSKMLNISISNYNIIDLENVTKLIQKYLNMNKNHIYTNINTFSSETFGNLIQDHDLFFISNYCYTEINKELNDSYSKILLPKTLHGFIIWQNGGNKGSYPVIHAEKITGKTILNVIEEKPQTDRGDGIYKNYFVYF